MKSVTVNIPNTTSHTYQSITHHHVQHTCSTFILHRPQQLNLTTMSKNGNFPKQEEYGSKYNNTDITSNRFHVKKPRNYVTSYYTAVLLHHNKQGLNSQMCSQFTALHATGVLLSMSSLSTQAQLPEFSREQLLYLLAELYSKVPLWILCDVLLLVVGCGSQFH